VKRILILVIAVTLDVASSFGQQPQSTLYIVNDSKGGGFAMRPLTLKVLDGNQELASVKNHQVMKLSIAAGVHGFALKIASKDRTVLTAKPGETYFLRVSVDQGLAYAGTKCVLLKPEEAVYWIPEAQQFVAAQPTPVVQAPPSPQTPAVVPVSAYDQTLPKGSTISTDSSGSLGDAARRAKQRKACLELAKDNPSITCK
jgi:hypothetical protein